MPIINYYDVLEVKRTASQQAIKKSYRIMAKKYHPDVYKGDKGERFRLISEAYETLSNQMKRAHYDTYLLQVDGLRLPEIDLQAMFEEFRKSSFISQIRVDKAKDFVENIFIKGENRKIRFYWGENLILEINQNQAMGLGLAGLLVSPLWAFFAVIGTGSILNVEVIDEVIEFYNDAVRYQKLEQLDKALEIYKKVIKMDRFFAPAYLNVGAIYQAKGDLYKAINYYEKVLELDEKGETTQIAKENLQHIRGY